MTHVDFRARIGGKAIEKMTSGELHTLKSTLDSPGLKTGVIQSSLCKIHLPGEERVKAEMEKLDGIIRASEILNCRLVRTFNFWQHPQDDPRCGELAMRPDALAEVLDLYAAFVKKAKEAGLILGFENCGQTPDEAIAVLEALNEPEWGLAWDVGARRRSTVLQYVHRRQRRVNSASNARRGSLPGIFPKTTAEKATKAASVGGGSTRGDKWAVRISKAFTERVRAQVKRRPGVNFIPGLFSWSNTIFFGSHVGTTPNGRFAGDRHLHYMWIDVMPDQAAGLKRLDMNHRSTGTVRDLEKEREETK